jgi:GAF domain-containing protein
MVKKRGQAVRRPIKGHKASTVRKRAPAEANVKNENSRLRHELAEAREQQAVTSELLQVIGRSSFDLQEVFETLAANAVRLCEAQRSFIFCFDGQCLRVVATHNASAEIRAFVEQNPITPGRSSATARAALERRTVHVLDAQADPEHTYRGRQVDPFRTILTVPMLKADELLGVILVYRHEVRPFTDSQIALLETFANQAVIAIGNVRLFEEVHAKTRDLSEALEQKTANAEVLKVISRSAFDLQPVLDTIVQTASRLCDAEFAQIYKLQDDKYHLAATNNAATDFVRYSADHPLSPGRGSLVGRTALDRKTVHLPDCLADPEYEALEYQSMGQYRSILGVPLLREGVPIGVIALMRAVVLPFTDKQIELVSTFADQAVIAIENVRLFDEVQARTEDLRESLQQQTATADVLKVISRSAFDLNSVLDTLVSSAAHLCDADGCVIFQRDGDVYRFGANYGFPSEFTEYARAHPIQIDRSSATGRVALEGKTIQIPDVLSDPDYTTGYKQHGQYRTVIGVPLLRGGTPIGSFSLTRLVVQSFTARQIELVETFADQAVIAIENARLFDEVQERTRELSQSLDDLRSAQDRLVQTEKLASLGQLTAGIAHEIKNPLNFVNNFSAVSVDLIDEMQETLGGMQLDEDKRAEMNQLAGTLRSNLDKVVQHGKRADAIVKNMLLHSRQGSGEHRPVDVNALVEESLNLAYHGARAEKQGFNITLKRSFDPNAGEIDVFPQEITRVLLNLISNGFYAATKRKGQADRDGYEPTLAAATKNLGDSVEIRIRDSGIGIPPEVKEKIFNPFFTTKPAGEGTGLGLSLSYDIVVKQHGGSIEVDTQPGEFTEFKVILPRIAATSKAGADK